MIVINKSVFCGNLDGARLLGHPVYMYLSVHFNFSETAERTT